MDVQPVLKKVILVTGCSSGLGFAIARQLSLSNKYKVVVTAREQSFRTLKDTFINSENLMLLSLDVTNPDQIYSAIHEVCRRWGRIDVLVNNAGVCFRSVVEHMDEAAEDIQLRTNYLGPLNMIKAVLPLMREQRRGHIINISSVSGMVSMPTMASYSASKHALEGASEALWYEARPYGISVSVVQPGFVNSPSFRHVVLSKKALLSQDLHGPHSEYYDSMAPFIESLMKYSFTTPEAIAKKIQRLIEMKKPPLRMKVTLDAFIFGLLRRMIPAFLFHRVMFYFLPKSKQWGKPITRRPACRRKVS